MYAFCIEIMMKPFNLEHSEKTFENLSTLGEWTLRTTMNTARLFDEPFVCEITNGIAKTLDFSARFCDLKFCDNFSR